MTTQLQIRSDTAANWTSANPTLLSGEMGFDTTSGRLKIGDGSTAWTSLGYLPVTSGFGSGFSNMVVQTTGTAASYTLPAQLQVANAKWKVTIVGGGGQGGGTAATAGHMGGGGGSGGVVVVFLTYVAGQNTMTYTVGAAGSGAGTNAVGTAGGSSSIVYNSVTYTAGGGGGGGTSSSPAAGTGGTATGGTLNLVGFPGAAGGVSAATAAKFGNGGSTPLGLGQGGIPPNTVTSQTAGSGYGAGGSGAYNGATATAAAGGAGTAGLIIIEY